MSLVANICSSPLVQPLVHSTAYGNTTAQVDLMKQFTTERGMLSDLIMVYFYQCFLQQNACLHNLVRPNGMQEDDFQDNLH